MTDVAGVMTDDNGLYYMRARYYNVNIKRFINQDVVHGSINVSQSLNRYSYVQGNPIKLTDPFGLSPLDRLNWKNLGHAILNGLGLIPVIGEAFDIANAIWYAHDGEYGMAVLSMMSALPMIGNIASGIMTAAKITTAAKIVSTVCKVVSNAATFTQAAIGGVNNAKAIVKNMINGKLFSEDTAKNLVSFGINAFTAATSGKNLLSSSKELKKVVGDSVGSKWGKKAKKEPMLECNLQFFAKKSGGESRTYYHVTNDEAAQSIIESGYLGKKDNAWESRVFAWTEQPTRKQASIAGIGNNYNTVIQFETNASFELDRGNEGKSIANIVVQTTDGQLLPIPINNAKIVGYKKEWWQFWK